MRLLLTAHLGVTPTCAEARVRITPSKVVLLTNTNKPPNTQKGQQHVAIKAQVDKPN